MNQPNYDSKEFIIKNIIGYVLIPKDNWKLVTAGDKVKYIDVDGHFRQGGYIWTTKNTNDGETYWVVGQTIRYKKSSRKFILRWDKIKYLWKKISPEIELLRKSIDRKDDLIKDLAAFLYLKYGDEFRNFMNEKNKSRNT
jgi:hypothetical protein